MAKKKSSSRKKAKVSSPFAQAKTLLTNARSLAKNGHHQEALVVVQNAVTALKPLAEKGSFSHTLAYIDALATAGLIALSLDLPNKASRILNECVSLALDKIKNEPHQYADNMVTAIINVSQAIGQIPYDSLREKLTDDMRLMVELLTQLNTHAPPQFILQQYHATDGLINTLTRDGSVEQTFVYLDSLHHLAQSLPIMETEELATDYALQCLQHASLLLTDKAYDKATSIAHQAQQLLDDIAIRFEVNCYIESAMAQMIQAEVLCAQHQYAAVIEQLTVLETDVSTQYNETPDMATEVYIQLLMLWGDSLVALGNEETGAEKFKQAQQILDQSTDTDFVDKNHRHIDLYWRSITAYLRNSKFDMAIEMQLKALSIDEYNQQNSPDPCAHPLLIPIRQALVTCLILTGQWQEAVEQTHLLMPCEQDSYQAFKLIIEGLSQELADDANAQGVACCQQVLKLLAQ